MNEFASSFEPFFLLWSKWMIQASIQAALVGLLVVFVVTTFRISSQLKHALLFIALLKFVFPPFIGFPIDVLGWTTALPKSNVVRTQLPKDSPSEHVYESYGSEAIASSQRQPSSTKSRKPGRVPIEWTDETEFESIDKGSSGHKVSVIPFVQPSSHTEGFPTISRLWVFLFYVSGIVIVTVPVCFQFRRLRNTLRSSIEMPGSPDDMSTYFLQPIRVLISDRATSPFSSGCFRPTIVIPRGLHDVLTKDELNVVLEHEKIHHLRGDLWLNALQILVTRIWWFHPISWGVSSLLRKIREDCCDDVVLTRRKSQDQDYCEVLMKVASWTRQRPPCSSLALSMASSHPLEKRLRRIMNSSIGRTDRLSFLSRMVAIVVACFLLPGISETSENRPSQDGEKPIKRSLHVKTAKGTVKDADGQPIVNAKVWISGNFGWEEKILGTGRTDDAGRFSIPCSTPTSDRFQFTVIAFHPQEGMAAFAAQQFPQQPTVLTIDRNIKTELTIVKPDGTPAAGIVVKPNYVAMPDRNITLHTNLQTQLAQLTDHNGKVTFQGISPNHYAVFHVFSKEFGQQNVYLAKGQTRDLLRLGAVGKVRGKIELPSGISMREFKQEITFVTNWNSSIDLTPHWNGVASIRPSDEATFEIPALLEGRVRIVAKDDGNSTWLAMPPRDILVGANRTTEIKIPVVRAMALIGRAIDQHTKKPIPNVQVVVNDHESRTRRVISDANGEFRINLKPGTTGSIRYEPPVPYVGMATDYLDGSNELKLPTTGKTHRLKPVQFVRGREIRGRLTDQKGEPKSGIRVTGSWRDSKNQERQVVTLSDRKGEFKLGGVDPSAMVAISAWENGVVVAADDRTSNEQGAVLLRLEPLELVKLAGRFIDNKREPLRQFEFRIVQSVSGPNQLAFCPVDSGRTDEQGYFVSSQSFPSNGKYHIEAIYDGGSLAKTNERKSTTSTLVTYADLVVTPPRQEKSGAAKSRAEELPRQRAAAKRFSAQVVDANGTPVSHAEVVGWSHAKRLKLTADKNGRFSLPIGNEVWIVVRAKGYRTHGDYYVATDKVIEIPLRSLSTAPDRGGMRAISEVRLTDKQWSKIRASFRQFGEKVMASEFDNCKFELQRIAPLIDPAYANNLLSDGRFDVSEINIGGIDDPDSWHRNHVRELILQQFARRGEFRRASKIGELITDPSVNPHLAIAKALPVSSPNHKDHLTRAYDMSNRLDSESEKAMALTEIAKQFSRRKDKKSAIETLDQAQLILKTLSGNQRKFVALSIARELSTCDPASAMGLIMNLKFANDKNKSRVYSEFAYLLRSSRPSDAEYLIWEAPGQQTRNDAVALAARMAVFNKTKAVDLAESIADPPLQCYALGMIARYLAKTDLLSAKAMLGRAFDELEDLIENGYRSGRSGFEPFMVGLALLLEVEEVSPDQLDEYFWRVISWRRDISHGHVTRLLGNHGEANTLRVSDPVLAAMVARYDRDLAKRILVPADDEELKMGLRYAPDFFFPALAVIDPPAASDAISQLPDETASEQQRKIKEWRRVGQILSETGISRWDWLRNSMFSLWTPDRSDTDALN